MSEDRPVGGHRFDVVRLAPEGWCVLCPWILLDGQWWTRLHVDGVGGTRPEAMAVADALNAACGLHDDH